MGSFGCCQARRIRLLAEGKEKEAREKRSFCLKCKKKLAWYDNVPILSWLILRGKCRYCGKEIGRAEILSEVAGAMSFGLVGWSLMGEELTVWTGVRVGILIVWLTVMLIVVIYDALYAEMPVGLLYVGVALGTVGFLVNLVGEGEVVGKLVSGGLAVMILGGTYFLLYKMSNEKLVGGGDYLMATAVALMLGDWWLALLTMFLANFVGAVVMLPLRKRRIPFGPFLYLAFVAIYSFSEFCLRLVSF